MIASSSPLRSSLLKPMTQPSVPENRAEIKTNGQSADPPVDAPSSKRNQMQELRLAVNTLNVLPVRELADYLEVLDDRGKISNDRFGLYGVRKLSQLPLDSSLWNEIEEYSDTWKGNRQRDTKWIGIRPEYRQMIKDMAGRILDPKNASLMNEVHGGDGIFDPGELSDWLLKNNRSCAEPDAKAFHDFYKSVMDLNGHGVSMMEWLEWNDNPKTIPDNKRFGMRGVQLLSQLTPASKQWESSGSGNLDDSMRQRLIHAAKVLMNPDNLLWQFQLHGGDQIFEADDMKNWLFSNRLIP